jgi:DNA-binding GntR family transcriptional regulator
MPRFRRADNAFHLAIADAARNPLIRRAVEDGRVAMFLPLDALEFEVLQASALEGHRKILAAITAANAPEAERATAAHIEDTRRELRLVLAITRDAAG